MNKEALWLEIVKKHPHFLKDEDSRLTGKGAKKLFDLAFDMGVKEGADRAEATKSMFEKVFGSKG